MNHIYRIVFNRSQGIWQAVSENARGQGMGSRRLKPAANRRSPSVLLKAATLVMAMAGICSVQLAWAQTITGSGEVNPGSIPPAPLPWEVGSDLYVGINGMGTLDIFDGGDVSNDAGVLGVNAGGNGTATVSGIGSTWTNRSHLVVGYTGTGTLNIKEGGTVISQHSWVGDKANSNGVANVSGEKSAWNANQLFIGGMGAGTLNITEGGSVTNSLSNIGQSLTGHGKVTVSGDKSNWTNTDILAIGSQGTGTLTIQDGATVASAKGYLGSGATGHGTVDVSGRNSAWNTTDSLIVGGQGTGALSIADAGRVVVGSGVDFTGLALDAGSTGTINIGAASALPADATGAGTIETARIDFGAGTASLNFNHTDSNYVFATPLHSFGAGTHRLNHYAGTTLLSGDSSGFTGTTTVIGGTLVVGMGGMGKLGGTLTVDSGATLQGTGSVGTTTLQSGAILAPGNSIGTLTVAGDLHFLPGSVFRIEANDQGQADKVMVAGTADLAGTVQVQASGAAFTPRTDYTILSAGTLVGQFDAASINTSYEFLQPELSYTSTEVSLALVRKPAPEPGPEPQPTPMQFHDAAVSSNQYATADGIESLPDTNPVYRQIETLPAGRAPQALDALSGELHASTQAALLAIADTPRERLFSHLRANFRADTATDVAKPIHPLWAEVSTRQLRLGNDTHIAQARLDSTSLTVGADAALGKDWRAGAALHYDNGKLKINDRSSQSDLESVGLTLGAGRGTHCGIGRWAAKSAGGRQLCLASPEIAP